MRKMNILYVKCNLTYECIFNECIFVFLYNLATVKCKCLPLHVNLCMYGSLGSIISSCDLQVESETADSEFKLSNATQRLLQLEKDVVLLKEKALKTSTTAETTERDTDSVNELAEQIKKVPVYSIKLVTN